MLYEIVHRFVIKHVLLLYLLILFLNLFCLDLRLIDSYDVIYLDRFILLLKIYQNMRLLVLITDVLPSSLIRDLH